MLMCYKCRNQTDFTIIDNSVGCNICKRIIFEKKVQKKHNKNKHLKNVLRKFNHHQIYNINQLTNELHHLCLTDNSFEITPKSVKKFLRTKGHSDWIFYYQFLNSLNNIELTLSSEEIEVITMIANRFFGQKSLSLKKLLPMIFRYLEIDFCIKPEYTDNFLNVISQTNFFL